MRFKYYLSAIMAAITALMMSLSIAQAQNVADIKSQGFIRIGVMVDIPPFGMMNDQNQPIGYDVDVAKLFGKYLGVETRLVPVTGPNRIPYLISGQVDILVASLGITEERIKIVDFSAPYVGISTVVYGKKNVDIPNLDVLKTHFIGVVRASTQEAALLKIMPADKLRRFDDDASTAQALLSGQIDIIANSSVVVSEIQKVAGDKFDIKLELTKQVQGITVRKGNKEMLDTVNEFIAKVKQDSELNALHEKWIGTPLPELHVPDFMK